MSKSRTIRWVLLIAAVAAAGYFGWQRFHGETMRRRPTTPKSGAPARLAVPVKIAPVEKADFPVYLTGLGTVQGFNTVLVRTRVDGQINKIAFKEGQFVKQGDTLVEIDPRPFQAALDQAKAKKAQDEANLANANLDLQRFTKLGEFATRQQTDTQRSTVAQLTAQIAADDGGDRQRADPARLRHRQGADLGRRRAAPGRRRQHRQCRDPDRHRHHRPDRADRGDLHRAGRPVARYQGSAGGRAAEDDRAIHRRQARAVHGHAGADQQPGRHHERDYPAQGGVRQQGPCAVAGPVGFDPAADQRR